MEPLAENLRAPIDPKELARVERAEDEVAMRRAAASSGKGNLPAAIDHVRTNHRTDFHPVPLGSLPAVPYAVPLDLDPRVVDNLLPKNSKNETEHADVLASMRNAFEGAYKGLEALGKARSAAAANEAWTPAEQLRRVGEMSDKTVDRVTGAFDKAHKFLTELVSGLDRSLSEPLAAGTRDQLAVEIREHVKHLPEDKRGAFVGEAMKKNDVRTLQAILGAPAFLSGLGESHHTMFTKQYRSAANPAAVARLEVARKGLELLEKRAGLILREAERAMGGSFAKLKKVREANSAAEAALVMQNALE
jgi:hypothetical protein